MTTALLGVPSDRTGIADVSCRQLFIFVPDFVVRRRQIQSQGLRGKHCDLKKDGKVGHGSHSYWVNRGGRAVRIIIMLYMNVGVQAEGIDAFQAGWKLENVP